jgi:hypothetical protein
MDMRAVSAALVPGIDALGDICDASGDIDRGAGNVRKPVYFELGIGTVPEIELQNLGTSVPLVSLLALVALVPGDRVAFVALVVLVTLIGRGLGVALVVLVALI